MQNPLRIDYLATFDTGNASIRWPQKNASKANRHQHLFDSEIHAAIKVNLLLKPFISIRHFELFDNLALAKFASAHPHILRRLSEDRLIRTCSPLASSWEEICRHWALRNIDEPMHWHHLTPERQRSYDVAFRKGRIRDVQSLETHLWLDEHKDVNGCPLSLKNMVTQYDELFPPHRIIVANSSRTERLAYADLVKQELDAYLKERRMLEGRLPTVVSKIEETIRKCCELGVRRRDFYTKLEALEHELQTSSRRPPRTLAEEVKAAKALVINEAFYKDFQQFDRYSYGRETGNACIVANRDVTETQVPCEGIVRGERGHDLDDPLEKDTLPILDAISLEDILEWHTASYTEASSFQISRDKLQQVYAMPPAARKESEVSVCMHEHLKNIRECVKRSLRTSGKMDMVEAPWSEVYFGWNPDKATGVMVAGLVALARYLDINTDILAAVSAGFLTVLFRKPTKSHTLHHFETTLETELRAGLT
jgi:hypothetical protein